MKKIATLSFIVLLLTCCGQKQKKEVYPELCSGILQYTDSFAVSHLDMFNNGILKEKANEEYKSIMFERFLHDSISQTNGIVVEVKSLKKINQSSKYQIFFIANVVKRDFSIRAQYFT